jgi:hypothetical protein
MIQLRERHANFGQVALCIRSAPMWRLRSRQRSLL